jgi:hypothetical protein
VGVGGEIAAAAQSARLKLNCKVAFPETIRGASFKLYSRSCDNSKKVQRDQYAVLFFNKCSNILEELVIYQLHIPHAYLL